MCQSSTRQTTNCGFGAHSYSSFFSFETSVLSCCRRHKTGPTWEVTKHRLVKVGEQEKACFLQVLQALLTGQPSCFRAMSHWPRAIDATRMKETLHEFSRPIGLSFDVIQPEKHFRRILGKTTLDNPSEEAPGFFFHVSPNRILTPHHAAHLRIDRRARGSISGSPGTARCGPATC